MELLGDFSDRFEVEVFAYVLMGNHYHLLLRTLDANLSKSMQWLNTSYTRKFNLRSNRVGHLFQGRYKSLIVENDAYLLQLSCYIHRNPLRAGIADRLADYPWSSYRAYAYGSAAPQWLKTDLILGLMSGAEKNKKYRNMVQQYSDETTSPWEDAAHGLIYGSGEFAQDIRDRFLSTAKDPELPQKNSIYKQFSPEEILAQAAGFLDFDMAGAAKARRIPAEEKDKRNLLVYLLWESGRLANQEIGSFFGLSYSAVSRCVNDFRQRMGKDEELDHQFRLIKSQIKV